MIFIFTSIFLSVSLTFCNSYFMDDDDNYHWTTHITVMTEINREYFRGLWVDELPLEIVAQLWNTCELLQNPIVIPDKTTISSASYENFNKIHSRFIRKIGHIPEININHNVPIFVKDEDLETHLLRCDRTTESNYTQTIYISKLLKYESLIMLANTRESYFGPHALKILGFLVEFIDSINSTRKPRILSACGPKYDSLDAEDIVVLSGITIGFCNSSHVFHSCATISSGTHTNDWEFFSAVFNNLIQLNKVDEDNETDSSSSELNIDDLTVESRVLLLRLCASVLRVSSKKTLIRSSQYLKLDVTYEETDFSDLWKKPPNINEYLSLVLPTIKCVYRESKYYLISNNSDIRNLFVIYNMGDEKYVDLLRVPDKDTYLIEYAFTYIRKEIL